MICVIGNKGNMGRRYSAVLRKLSIPFIGVDINEVIPRSANYKYLVCTPTDTHWRVVTDLHPSSEIFCEKPISKNINQVIDIIKNFERFYMINNWRFLIGVQDPIWEHSYYNYFKTGNDGFHWDLIQPIYYSRSTTLGCSSPEFNCKINNTSFNQLDFDFSYIEMIKHFIERKNDKKMLAGEDIFNAHSIICNWEVE